MGRKNAVFLCLAVTALVTLGLVMLTSTSIYGNDVEGYSLVKRQAVWIAVGVIGAVVVAGMDYRKFRAYWIWLFLGACALLVCCYIPGIAQEVKGESRWVKFPGLPQFQPSELAKIFVIMGLAAWYTPVSYTHLTLPTKA